MSNPGKHDGMVTTLRRRIIAGRYKAGDRLPTVRELAVEFAISLPTVVHALSLLAEQGFIITEGRLGTRVVDFPPHRHRFGLVLPGLPGPDRHYASLHWQALADAACAVGGSPNSSITLFHAVNEHPELVEHQRLLEAMRNRTVAGLIICQPLNCDAWLDLRRVRLPMIGGSMHPDYPGHPEHGTIILAQEEFQNRAIERCAKAGRQRLAILLSATPASYADVPRLMALASRHGLDCPAHRVLAAPLAAPDWARPAIAAMVRGGSEGRPDALLVSDDNLLAPVLAALDEAGIGPDEIFVVAHTNFPLSAAATLPNRPVLRLGWDQREYLHLALDVLKRWLAHREPPGERALSVRAADQPFDVTTPR